MNKPTTSFFILVLLSLILSVSSYSYDLEETYLEEEANVEVTTPTFFLKFLRKKKPKWLDIW